MSLLAAAATWWLGHVGAPAIQANIIDPINAAAGCGGAVPITPSGANTPTAVTVTFPTPFAAPPTITQATAVSTVPGTGVVMVSVSDITTTNMKVWVDSTSTTVRTVSWYAAP